MIKSNALTENGIRLKTMTNPSRVSWGDRCPRELCSQWAGFEEGASTSKQVARLRGFYFFRTRRRRPRAAAGGRPSEVCTD